MKNQAPNSGNRAARRAANNANPQAARSAPANRGAVKAPQAAPVAPPRTAPQPRRAPLPAAAPGRSARRRRQNSLPVPLWVLAVAASVVVVVVLALLSNHPPTAQLTNTIAPPNGATAPDFSATAADDKTYSLSQFRGSPVLVEFMAPWCSHCQAEAPMFNQIHDTYAPKGVQMLGVSSTPYGHTYDQTNS